MGSSRTAPVVEPGETARERVAARGVGRRATATPRGCSCVHRCRGWTIAQVV